MGELSRRIHDAGGGLSGFSHAVHLTQCRDPRRSAFAGGDILSFVPFVNRNAMTSVVDASGVAVSVAVAPRRIVSLIPSITEILFSLGLGDAVVKCTVYC